MYSFILAHFPRFNIFNMATPSLARFFKKDLKASTAPASAYFSILQRNYNVSFTCSRLIPGVEFHGEAASLIPKC